jgi:hypothetical protein
MYRHYENMSQTPHTCWRLKRFPYGKICHTRRYPWRSLIRKRTNYARDGSQWSKYYGVTTNHQRKPHGNWKRLCVTNIRICLPSNRRRKLRAYTKRTKAHSPSSWPRQAWDRFIKELKNKLSTTLIYQVPFIAIVVVDYRISRTKFLLGGEIVITPTTFRG